MAALLERLDGNVPLSEAVWAALQELLERDAYLLRHNLNERSISHRLASHLQRRLEGWDVDCEDNRNHDDPKTLPLPRETVDSDDTEARTVFPDIIVHRRGSDENLLVIELKKSTNPEGETGIS